MLLKISKIDELLRSKMTYRLLVQRPKAAQAVLKFTELCNSTVMTSLSDDVNYFAN